MPTIAEVLKTSDGRTTAEVLTTSSGTAAGDTLLIIYGSDYYTAADMGTVTSSAGTPSPVCTADAGDLYAHIKVFTVDVATSGAKTVTIPAAINCDIHGVVIRFSGDVNVDDFDVGAWNGVTSTHAAVAPSVDTTGTNRTLVCAWIQKSGDFPGPYSLPGGMTLAAETAANPFSDMAVATEDIAAAGATGTRTATWPGTALTQWCAVSVAMASASTAVSGDVTATTTAGVTATGANAAVGSATATTTTTTTATGANAAAGAVTATTTASTTATGVNAAAGAVNATTTTTVTATATVTGTEVIATTTTTVIAEATVTRAATGSGWYGLLDIVQESAALAAAERSAPPVACPNDGVPLREGPGGILHCTFDGYRWEG
ncbi:hypothetical protein J5X84_36150 [Streptosporangiaceae bacterium NEAU-GS5]|nr:hypothetical protein [Streptosporangiaceae bacterium NEAU-GS5]